MVAVGGNGRQSLATLSLLTIVGMSTAFSPAMPRLRSTIAERARTRPQVCMQETQTRSTAARPSTNPSTPFAELRGFTDNRTPQEIAEQGRQLLQEAVKLSQQTPPNMAIARTLQASRAVLLTVSQLVQRYSAQGRAPTTEELLADAPATIRTLFDRLGATYIKLGQFVASSPTLFPAEYVEEFQKCLDDTEPVPFSAIQRTIRAELGKDPALVFSFIDPTPLATASIAQVHAATLLTGEDVVIKVQKPGVGALLKADLAFVSFSAKFLEFVNPDLSRLSLGDIMGDIRTTMLDELDFEKEARNMAEFRSFLSSSNNRQVTVPDVYPQGSTKKILTMTRLYGKPLVDLDAIRAYTSSPEDTLILALNTWMASVVGCSSFHADVHAGNLLVLTDGRIGFIDFGIVGKISPKTWQAVEGLAEGFSLQDYDKMASALVRLGATSAEVDEKAFAADIRQVIEKLETLDVDVLVEQRGESVTAAMRADDEEVTRILLDLAALGQSYGIKFPRDFGLLVKQALYFDRYTKLLAPGVDPLKDERIRTGMRKMATNDPPVVGAIDVSAK
ncbi:ABC1 family-domain-containing protein [Baffinella frigidus]|nr:ABC1 family-domain-containing protein [Cryptophyta sp. CCMP2293]